MSHTFHAPGYVKGQPSRTTESLSADEIRALLDGLTSKLPTQGPASIFRHENAIEAFENMRFVDAASLATQCNGTRSYLSENQYHELVATGEIDAADIDGILKEDLCDSRGKVGDLATAFDIRRTLLSPSEGLGVNGQLQPAFPQEPCGVSGATLSACWDDALRAISSQDPELHPVFSRQERQWLKRSLESIEQAVVGMPISAVSAKTKESALRLQWLVCLRGMKQVGRSRGPAPACLRLRDLLLAATGEDTDRITHRVLIPFCEAFLFAGAAKWKLPDREAGFFTAFAKLYQQVPAPGAAFQGLPGELTSALKRNLSPVESIRESLAKLGADQSEMVAVLESTALSLPCWAGLIHRLGRQAFTVDRSGFEGVFAGFMAVRLLLERLSAEHVLRTRMKQTVPLYDLRQKMLRQFATRQLPQNIEERTYPIFRLAVQLGWNPVSLMKKPLWVWATIASEVEGFSDLHKKDTFQRAWERGSERTFLREIRNHDACVPNSMSSQNIQMIFCSSNSEEEIRRQVECIDSCVETFGTQGHFGLSFQYHSKDKPNASRPMGSVDTVASRHVYEGALTAPENGRHFGFRKIIEEVVCSVRCKTLAERLPLLVIDAKDGPVTMHGFSVPEMAEACEQLIRSIGLGNRFSPLVLLIGHSYTGVPQPCHCGLCGSAGVANVRVAAQMLNDGRVRELLQERGVRIPAETTFVAGLHRNDKFTVDLFESDFYQGPNQPLLAQARLVLEEACLRERDCLMGGPKKNMSGHAKHAICIVGRRASTRGLTLNRRAFLVSYDHETDTVDSDILVDLFRTAVSDCIRINLQYYFSHVDPDRFGTGDALPWEASTPFGVINGKDSDMRSGLSWSVVQDHRPLRLLVIVEASSRAINTAFSQCKFVQTLVQNGWIRLVNLDSSLGVPHPGQSNTSRF